ncbi:hypothetical protein HG536_0B06590 [Torulaspora globosa]|uniref:ABC transporter domain-containing protein n=1 Tax=Torulaspora globosa TaxID=48254 RepID=A0A7G3ZE55_9SACH|nr:uncharacterized protein HG536_0B06590 [Torulaspora globosa]QLL31791.1 hypothetical protein HG536_0B06590 [Torulaspora globosa]
MSFAVEVEKLTYEFSNGSKPSLVDIDLQIPWNTRTLIVGANGAGKSTLLKVLSGKHLCRDGKILVNGLNPFSPAATVSPEDGCLVTTYLGTEWCHMSVINRDIGVSELLESIGLAHFQERGDLLCKMLDVDLKWRMFRLSDGQKRRVQLVMGLLKPWKVLLLDEVTVDLDVIARSRLLQFLKWETQTRECSVMYATHIFDGLAEWPDQLLHLKDGRIVDRLDLRKNVQFTDSANGDGAGNGTVTFTPPAGDHDRPLVSITKVESLHPLAVAWLSQDPNELKQMSPTPQPTLR